jgi:glycosyltransferase involved in cell wall biosynthesis
LKILFPFVGDSVGGSHISTLALYSLLIDANITAVIILHEDKGLLSQYLRNKDIPFYILKSSKLAGESPNKLSIIIGILANFINFSKFIKTHGVDIVHGNDLRINLTWFLPAKVFAKGFVWHQRTLLSNSKLWLLIRYLCDYFVAISSAVMMTTPKNIKNYQKKIVHNPFNLTPPLNKKLEREVIINEYNLPQNCLLLGCVGRIVDYKNIDFLINNVNNFYHNVNKNVYLIVVGTGTEKYINKLKAHISKLGINSHIIFTGFLHNPNKIIASIDLLVAPSVVDAFGRTIIEAMLQRTPVLAAKSGGHLGIISEGTNGTFYEPNIEGDFIDKVSNIMNNKDIDIMSENAYQFAKNNFSSKQHLDEILSIYNYLLSG